MGVPVSISECSRLEVLKLQNNELQTLPHEIGIISEKLREIDVSNNNGLEMIPKPMRGNSEIVMWIIGLHHVNALKLLEVEKCNRDMFKLLNESGEGIVGIEREIKKMDGRKTELLLERASLGTYLQLKQLKSSCSIM